METDVLWSARALCWQESMWIHVSNEVRNKREFLLLIKKLLYMPLKKSAKTYNQNSRANSTVSSTGDKGGGESRQATPPYSAWLPGSCQDGVTAAVGSFLALSPKFILPIPNLWEHQNLRQEEKQNSSERKHRLHSDSILDPRIPLFWTLSSFMLSVRHTRPSQRHCSCALFIHISSRCSLSEHGGQMEQTRGFLHTAPDSSTEQMPCPLQLWLFL